jgi:hypothetical protein
MRSSVQRTSRSVTERPRRSRTRYSIELELSPALALEHIARILSRRCIDWTWDRKRTAVLPSFVHVHRRHTIGYMLRATAPINSRCRKRSKFRNCTLVSRTLCRHLLWRSRSLPMKVTVLGHRSEGVASSPFGVLSLAWFMDSSTSFRSSGVIVRNASRCL